AVALERHDTGSDVAMRMILLPLFVQPGEKGAVFLRGQAGGEGFGAMAAGHPQQIQRPLLLPALDGLPSDHGPASRAHLDDPLVLQCAVGAKDRFGIDLVPPGHHAEGGEPVAGTQLPNVQRRLDLLAKLLVDRDRAAAVEAEFHAFIYSRALALGLASRAPSEEHMRLEVDLLVSRALEARHAGGR